MPDKPTNYELLMQISIEQAVQHEKVDQILEQAKLTNGRVTEVEKFNSTIKLWTVKAIGIAMLATSWIWIKESRDFVLTIFKSI